MKPYLTSLGNDDNAYRETPYRRSAQCRWTGTCVSIIPFVGLYDIFLTLVVRLPAGSKQLSLVGSCDEVSIVMEPSLDLMLLEAVDNKGPIDLTSLSEQLDTHPITIDQQCYELQVDGYLTQVTGGVYTITDDGQDHLAYLHYD